MNTTRITLSLGLPLCALALTTGCGLTDMPGKIDQSNATQTQLLNGIQQSNGTQGQLLNGIQKSNGTQGQLLSGINNSNTTQGQLLNGINQSNNTQTQLLAGIGTSNDTQTKLLAGIGTSNDTQLKLLAGIGTSNSTQTALQGELAQSIDVQQKLLAGVLGTNTKMDTTNGFIQLQAISTATQIMFGADATANMNPVAWKMIPPGTIFSQAATETQFMGTMGIYISDLMSQPDDSDKSLLYPVAPAPVMPVPAPTAPGAAPAPTPPAPAPALPTVTNDPSKKWLPSFADTTNNSKLADLWAVKIIAGSAPQALIEQTVQTEMTSGGPNSTLVPMVLSARWDFISNVMLAQVAMLAPLSNLGQVQQAVGLASELNYIDTLPFIRQIGMSVNPWLNGGDKSKGTFKQTLQPNLQTEATWWNKINTQISANSALQQLLGSNTKAGDQLKALQTLVQSHLPAATPKPASVAPVAPATH